MRLSRANIPLASEDRTYSQAIKLSSHYNLAPHFRLGFINLQHFCHSRWRNPVRLSKSGMGAALEEAARGFKVFGELAEIGRVVLVAARAPDGRAASLLGWRLAAERGARARHHALHGADQRGLDAAGAGCGHQGCPYACRRPCACSYS